MENLSEYIPLLIILASVLFTMLKKKKPQGKVTQETTLPGQTAGDYIDESDLPQSFKDLFQVQVEEKPKKKKQRKPEVKPVKPVKTFTPAPVILESEEEVSSPFSFEEEDDLIKAVVYSEILKRKEY